jgi:hypothetical protein
MKISEDREGVADGHILEARHELGEQRKLAVLHAGDDLGETRRRRL